MNKEILDILPNHPINSGCNLNDLALDEAAKNLTEAYGPEVDVPMEAVNATFKLLERVKEPSDDEKKALMGIFRGAEFFETEARSIAEVVVENPHHFWSKQPGFLAERPELANYVPPAMTVALSPHRLFIPDSFYISHAAQLEMTEGRSISRIEPKLPDARIVHLPASALAQIDVQHMRQTGHPLFINSYGRALDKDADSGSIDIGRFGPQYRLVIGEHDSQGDPFVGAVMAVVFLRESNSTSGSVVTPPSHLSQQR